MSSITQVLIAATLLASAPFALGQDRSAPNIILIFADDQGWNHLSVPMDDELPGSGSDYFRTPNIDRIVASGMRFPNAYAAAPMCGPSRVALHYGKGTAQVMYSEAGEIHTDSGHLHLFDIAQDLREQRDLAGRMPELVEELHQRLMSYLDAVDATIPDPSTMTSGPVPGAGMGMGASAMGMGVN